MRGNLTFNNYWYVNFSIIYFNDLLVERYVFNVITEKKLSKMIHNPEVLSTLVLSTLPITSWSASELINVTHHPVAPIHYHRYKDLKINGIHRISWR
jgi:hypothetical protein